MTAAFTVISALLGGGSALGLVGWLMGYGGKFAKLILIGAVVAGIVGATLFAAARVVAWGEAREAKGHAAGVAETDLKWTIQRNTLQAALTAARHDAESAQTALELRLITEEDRINAEREENQADLAGAFDGGGGDSIVPDRLLRSFRRASGQVGRGAN